MIITFTIGSIPIYKMIFSLMVPRIQIMSQLLLGSDLF